MGGYSCGRRTLDPVNSINAAVSLLNSDAAVVFAFLYFHGECLARGLL